jgi:hypothetical protein
MNLMNKYIAAEFFKAKTVQNIIDEGSFPDGILNNISGTTYTNNKLSYTDLYDNAYQTLRKNYRNEMYVKINLVSKLLYPSNSYKKGIVYQEFPVSKSVGDVLSIGREISIYEIKTAYDSLNRLKNQVENYYKISPFVSLVLDELKIKDIYKYNLPDSVGIWKIGSRGGISRIKIPTPNYKYISIYDMVNSLRKKEYVNIANRLKGSMKYTVEDGRVWSKIQNDMRTEDPIVFYDLFKDSLERRFNTSYAKEVAKFEAYLRPILLAKKYSDNDIQSLLRFMQSEVS